MAREEKKREKKLDENERANIASYCQTEKCRRHIHVTTSRVQRSAKAVDRDVVAPSSDDSAMLAAGKCHSQCMGAPLESRYNAARCTGLKYPITERKIILRHLSS